MRSPIIAATILVACVAVQADTFGTGANEFDIDFVTISGSTNPAGGYGIVADDYRMGTYEITNDQYAKFAAELGVSVTGDPSSAYEESPYWAAANVPSNNVSWYEAAQFVNWLNTSTGHQAAYKFTGTQGQTDYAFATWSAAEADGGTNLYRHKDAFYFLPTEDEWVKAGYWNGTALQTYATKPGDSLHQGDGVSGSGWNYYDSGYYATDPFGPWTVGSGSEELNGTHDMMGNVWEWLEGPRDGDVYTSTIIPGLRGGSYSNSSVILPSTYRYTQTNFYGGHSSSSIGFRVASEVPEPATMSLLALGGLAAVMRRRK